jgi:P-type Na+/K+ transporter
MGETVFNSTNGADHASASSDSSAFANPDDQPPIGGTTVVAIEKSILPHTLPAQRVAESFNSHIENGLTSEDAAARLERDGPNSIKGAKGISLWEIFLAQVANALTVVLIAVAVLSFAIQDYIEAGVVMAVIVLNIVVGYVVLTTPSPRRRHHLSVQC